MNLHALRLSENGLKATLKRVRSARTRQEKYLARVGVQYSLIDIDWLRRQFTLKIRKLTEEKAKVLARLKQVKEEIDTLSRGTPMREDVIHVTARKR